MTLLELLVVLVLMAISAGLVIPALSSNSASTRLLESGEDAPPENGAQFTPAESAINGVLTSARRLAIKRGEPVRLKMASDGVWAIVPLRGGDGIANGRAELPVRWLPDVVVDALGTCVLSPGVATPAGARAWDALACRWRAAR